MFSGGVMIQNKEDKRAWVCGVGPFPSLHDTKAEIEKYRKIHVVLCAWARENEEIVWFENHTNTLGMVDYKFID